MKIIFLTHYYPPEVNAPATRVSEMAQHWVEEGHDVTVVTCAPNHPRGKLFPGYRNRLFQKECVDGINVIRVWTYMAANQGVGKRLLSYLTYPVSVLINRHRLLKADLVISTSPQFFCGLAGWLLQTRNTPWILEIRDLWPESISAVGAIKHGPAIRFLQRLERWAYRTADMIVSVTDSFTTHIRALAPDTPIAVIKNGVNLAKFVPATAQLAAQTREELQLTDKLVAGYVGTHGMVHGLDTILEAAEILRDHDTISFIMVGDGAEKDRLEATAAAKGLKNIRFLGQRPRADIPRIWSSLDVSLVLLRRSDTFKSVLPSKMFEAFAFEKPVILGVEGEARDLLDDAGAGIAIQPENAAQLAAALLTLAGDAELREQLGRSGREFALQHFDRGTLANTYLEVMQEVVHQAQTK